MKTVEITVQFNAEVDDETAAKIEGKEDRVITNLSLTGVTISSDYTDETPLAAKFFKYETVDVQVLPP